MVKPTEAVCKFTREPLNKFIRIKEKDFLTKQKYVMFYEGHLVCSNNYSLPGKGFFLFRSKYNVFSKDLENLK